jgi:serine/threonine protein kinase
MVRSPVSAPNPAWAELITGNGFAVTSEDHEVAEPPVAEAAPRLLEGRYELGPVIGVGSSAVVRRARDLRLRVLVAVKQFRPGGSLRELRRQRQEMRMLARLRHPGLVQLRDAGTTRSAAFVVTDLVDGPSLAERIHTGPPMPPGAVRRVGAQLAEALAYTHSCGVVHRDVKPANVLLDHGQAKLADFGIATSIDRIATTSDGSVAGTAAYLAPEQARGERVGPAADMYSLGLVLLEAMTGRREYPGPQAESALARLQRPPVVPDEIPADFAVLIRDLTRDQPDARPTAAEAAATLAAGPTITPAATDQQRPRHRNQPHRDSMAARFAAALSGTDAISGVVTTR